MHKYCLTSTREKCRVFFANYIIEKIIRLVKHAKTCSFWIASQRDDSQVWRCKYAQPTQPPSGYTFWYKPPFRLTAKVSMWYILPLACSWMRIQFGYGRNIHPRTRISIFGCKNFEWLPLGGVFRSYQCILIHPAPLADLFRYLRGISITSQRNSYRWENRYILILVDKP